MIKKLILTALIVLAALTLAACAPSTTSKILSPEEGAAYAAEVDEIVENMLAGWGECDFATATRDFDPAWEGYFEKNPFPQLCAKVGGVYGAYQSKRLDQVEDRGRARVVIYRVVFENAPDVPVFVTFRVNDADHAIIGVLFENQ